MRPQDDRKLRGLLHEEAERHLPDADAIQARINRRRGSGRLTVTALRFGPAAAALAVAGVLVAGVTGIHLTSRQPAAGTPAPFLSATATLNRYSIDDWSQSDLTITTTDTITALDVTIRVARTARVADTGHWTTVPVSLITTGVTSTDAELVYRFALNAGATLAPGSYTFAAQYNHATGTRSLAGDSYEATATATGPAHVAGGFTG